METKSTNPILPGTWADPFVLQHGDSYYLYPTKDCPHWRHPTLYAFQSKDLLNWRGPAEILDLKEIAWAEKFAYAPTAAYWQGTFYLYFCADNQIGLAVSDEPLGRFADILQRPLIGRDAFGCQSIDPDLFIDSDGQPYLLWGQGKLWIAPLREDMHTFAAEPVCLSDQLYRQKGLDPAAYERDYRARDNDPYAFDLRLYNEGAHLQKIAGRYMLSWSVYDARDPRYQIHYAWSENVLGPYRMPEHNILLAPTETMRGTGHASIAKKETDYYLVYHRHGSVVPERDWHRGMEWNGIDGTDRQVCCDRIKFRDGEPVQIIPE